MLLITVLYKLLRFSEIRIKEKSKATLLLFISLITVLTIVFYPTKTGAELIYIMAPLAIFSANLLERLETIWIKEMILGFVLLCPVIQTFL